VVTKEQWLERCSAILEPSIGIGLVEHQLIRDVMIREGKVAMTIILSERSDEIEAGLRDQVQAIANETGHSDCHIRFRELSDIERADLVASLNGEPKPSEKQRTHADFVQSGLLQPESGVKFLAVASGKGGVGKSTVTANLAVALARLGLKVGLIDADIYGFSIPDMMGIEDRPVMEAEKVIPVERHGVKVMSMGFFVEDNTPVIWRGPMLGKMLRNFFHEVTWGELDVMLLDLPPGTGDVALDLHQMIPQAKEIIVTTPHATASFVAARAGTMAISTNHEVIGVVENMAYYQCNACSEKDYVFGRGGGAKLADELHTELLAQIPLGAPDNHPSERDFSPSVYKADSATGQIYLDLARSVQAKL
jgi:ATP-binding protein involved in chromosome partitioning